jgi:hypothetical protein
LITRTTLREKCRLLSSSLCSFLHYSVLSSIFGIIFSLAPYSQTHSAYVPPSVLVSNQVSHPYKTTGKIIVLCTLMFIFLDGKLEDKRFCTE